MTSLKEVNLSRCTKVTDAGIRHLISISTLEKLWISETGVTANGVALLSSLKNLSLLDLGGLPVTDNVLYSLQVPFMFLYIHTYLLYLHCYWLKDEIFHVCFGTSLITVYSVLSRFLVMSTTW